MIEIKEWIGKRNRKKSFKVWLENRKLHTTINCIGCSRLEYSFYINLFLLSVFAKKNKACRDYIPCLPKSSI